ncbi:CoA pyrophosphatase [Geobacter sulfurreducens]|uniref:CoA pyrophosphatase n=1 Tax=Geobacter sulfurreducens TaxID=35554 RepID=UPI002C81ACEE|nr:CoA pyrophosphatase [Geobacter sulfurreducens]HML77181.1 CoA pyrophosphatase [Geobacter sulfurreducens]
MDVPGITELAGRVRTTLAGRTRVPMAPGPIPAAVLLPLFERDGEVRVLFTKRTEHLNHHRGEISFPGGVSHPDDASPCETALRETWEEIGIPPDEVDILGELDDFYSVHDYLVTPCVGVIRGDRPLVVNPDEIERIIVVPLKHLLRPEIFRTEDWTWRGRTHPVHFYRYMDDEIWGLTAAILSQFLNTIFPRP